MPLPSVRLVATTGVLAMGGVFAHAAAAAPPPAGGLVQLAPPLACFSTVAAGGCASLGGGSITGPNGLASTPDGLNVYAVGGNGGAAAFNRTVGGALTSVSAPLHGTVLSAAPDRTGLAAGEGADGQALGGVQTYVRDPATGTLAPGAHIVDSCGTVACPTDNGLDDVQGVAYSGDGKSLYAASHAGGGNTAGAVTAFARNPTTQAISLIQCVPETQTAGGVCHASPAAEGLGGAEGLVVSPDGAFVYVASRFDGAVVGFNRVAAGAGLGKLGAPANCLTTGATTNACAQTPGLVGAAGLAISPDGRDLYVASFNSGIAVLRRNTVSGVLSFTECLASVASASCGADPALVAGTGARNVAVSPDGRYVYLAGGGGATGYLRAYARDGATGRLTPLNCLTNLGGGGCDTAAGLKNAANVNVSPDGRNVYSTSFLGGDGNGAIAAFRIEAAPSCSGGAVTTAYGQAVQLPLSCTDPDGEPLTRSIASAPAHGTLGAIDQTAGSVSYLPAAGYSGTDAVGFSASDGTNAAEAASVAVTVGANPAGGPSPVPTIAVSLKPVAKQRTRTVRAKGLRIKATCTPGCSLRLTLSLSKSEAKRLHLGKKKLTVATSRTTLRSGKAATIALKLTRKAKAALRHATRARFSLAAAATATGSKTTRKRITVTVRR
jgi:hypothetical protein